jgi:hypothetical protein
VPGRRAWIGEWVEGWKLCQVFEVNRLAVNLGGRGQVMKKIALEKQDTACFATLHGTTLSYFISADEG